MKFTSAKEITAKAATIKAYVREAIAVEKAGLRTERPAAETLFRRARELLTDSTSKEVRTQYALAGDPLAVQWVTDDGTCARLASALAAGRPPNTTMLVAAVHVGNFYLVRTD